MDNHEIDWERLDRFIAGRGTPDELDALRRWVESDPELRELAEAMRTVGRPPGVTKRPWDVRWAWQELRRRMRQLDRPPLHIAGVEHLAVPGWRRVLFRPGLAAALVLVIGAGASWVVVTGRARTASRDGAVSPMREVSTGRGQLSVLHLPDGSRVTLAPASRLRIPSVFPARTGVRDLYLEGEAYFEVRHDSIRPFRVHAATGVAEDLGTEFLVTAYPETRGMQVVVASGTVALRTADTLRDRAPRPLLTLTSSDLGRLDSTGTATLTRNVAVVPYGDWVRGTLAFNGTPLREVLATLARWYDLEIRLADSALSERRLTATVGGQSADQVLDLLALSLHLRVQRNGQVVVVSAGP